MCLWRGVRGQGVDQLHAFIAAHPEVAATVHSRIQACSKYFITFVENRFAALEARAEPVAAAPAPVAAPAVDAAARLAAIQRRFVGGGGAAAPAPAPAPVPTAAAAAAAVVEPGGVAAARKIFEADASLRSIQEKLAGVKLAGPPLGAAVPPAAPAAAAAAAAAPGAESVLTLQSRLEKLRQSKG